MVEVAAALHTVAGTAEAAFVEGIAVCWNRIVVAMEHVVAIPAPEYTVAYIRIRRNHTSGESADCIALGTEHTYLDSFVATSTHLTDGLGMVVVVMVVVVVEVVAFASDKVVVVDIAVEMFVVAAAVAGRTASTTWYCRWRLSVKVAVLTMRYDLRCKNWTIQWIWVDCPQPPSCL